MIKNYLFIYNSSSGKHDIADHLNKINIFLSKHDILVTLLPIKYALKYSISNDFLKRFDAIITSGGDGSVNFAINLIYKNHLNLPLGIIPKGTCNDLASSLSITDNLNNALEIIANGKTKSVDVGLINNKTCFATSFAGGQLIDVAFETDSNLKKNFGPSAYYLQALLQIPDLKFQELQIKVDTTQVSGKYLLFCFMNGNQVAGFSDLNSNSEIDDGLLELLLISECNLLELAQTFTDIISKNTASSKKIEIFKGRKFEIKSEEHIKTTIDGEQGIKLPAKVKVLPGFLKVFSN